LYAKESAMSISTLKVKQVPGGTVRVWTRLTITVLAVCAVGALAAPAWGGSDDITLRRDGSKAVPFVAEVSGQSDADLTPETAVANDGFDWGDAAIGAGLGALAVLLAVAATRALRGQRPVRAPSPNSGAPSG
jgi:hypothetical protein